MAAEMRIGKGLLCASSGGIATVTLDRPDKHNALDADLIQSLARLIGQLGADAAIRAVVLEGNGPSFCSGGDVGWLQAARDLTLEENERDAAQMAGLLGTLALLPKPVISLVHGKAYGGGAGIAACSDVVVASADATFCFSEVKLGMAPAAVAPYAVMAIGPHQAKWLFVTGQAIGAANAHRIGLVHEVVQDRDALDNACTRITQGLLANGPNAMARAKRMVREVFARPLDQTLIADTATWVAEGRCSEEGREGISAFLERRKASWRGD